MKLVQKVKSYFNNKYLALFELITFKLLLVTNRFVRKLLVLKGKNPDYVPPSPPPKEEPKIDMSKAQATLSNFYRANNPGWVRGEEWVKNPRKHPVLIARGQFESKPAPTEEPKEEVLQVAASAMDEFVQFSTSVKGED